MRATKFPGLEIETKILNNDSLEMADELTPGSAYGHVVVVGTLKSFYPVTLEIKSTLRDTRQLAFRESGEKTEDADSWNYSVTLYPDTSGGEEKKLLICSPDKIRKNEKITVKITGGGREETLPLLVSIE